VIDLGEEHDENAFNLIYINSELIANETDDSDSQCAKHDKQRTRIIDFSTKKFSEAFE
jgi:hypothetical protein